MKAFSRMCRAFLAISLVASVPAGALDTHSICVIRVDFPYEDPDHETTTGRGAFDLRDFNADSAVRDEYLEPWDVPPHDKTYFTHHLTALDTYWHSVSEGRVGIAHDIWPRAVNGAYTMKKKFYKYGNGRTDEQTYEKLIELVTEAVTTCKAVEGAAIDFSGYDTVMVVHAGMGSETSGLINDIPSAYVSADDFDLYGSGPVTVDGVDLEHCIVLPEMASPNGLIGLNGLMAQMFAYRLGLPSLSNNEDGIPGAGGWSLMDTGSMAWGNGTRGYIPTHPCIWSKIELGWIDPVVVTSDGSYDIAVTYLDNGTPRALKIPISGDEYLLLENRYRPASRDSLYASVTFSGPDSTGVWLSVDRYDSYIPGSGLLVWHVNDRIIREKRGDNAINDDPIRRGLDLLEADGIQDIGALFGLGYDRAEYAEGHDDDTFKSNGRDRLSPDTEPGTNSMWGGSSGITIHVNSEPGEVMNVTVTFSGMMDGFPVETGGAGHVTAGDLDGDGVDELIVTAGDSLKIVTTGGLTVYRTVSQGHPVLYGDPADGTYKLAFFREGSLHSLGLGDGGVTDTVLHTISDAGSHVTGAVLALTSIDGATFLVADDRNLDTSGVTSASSVILYPLTADVTGYSVTLPDTSHVRALAVMDEHLAIRSGERSLHLVRVRDSVLRTVTLAGDNTSAPVIADLDRDGSPEAIVTSGSRLLIAGWDGESTEMPLSDDPVGDPVAVDLDRDGYPEILIATRTRIWAFRHEGVRADGFPISLPPGDPDERIVSTPVCAVLDNDGDLDIAVATSSQRMISFELDGAMSRSFPLATRSAVMEPGAVFSRTASSEPGYAYMTGDGVLMAHALYGTTGASAGERWPMWRGGPSLSASVPSDGLEPKTTTAPDFEYYCYPNPVTGSTVTFRIIPKAATDCTVTLYSADGRKVYERHLSRSDILPGMPNEFTVDASRLSSGLYIARFQTRDATGMYKLGVLK